MFLRYSDLIREIANRQKLRRVLQLMNRKSDRAIGFETTFDLLE